MSMKLVLSGSDADLTNNSLRLDVLGLPHSQIEGVYVNDEKIDELHFQRQNESIKFSQPTLNLEDQISVYVTMKARRINFERNSAIVVALIGFAATILSVVLQPKWIKEFVLKDDPSGVLIFEPDGYGVVDDRKSFVTNLRWDRPSESNYSFSADIVRSHSAWAFLRVRKSPVDIRQAVVENVVGPMPLRNGLQLELEIPEPLYDEYKSKRQWLQMIVFAVPKDVTVPNGLRISNLGANAKILASPSIRSSAGSP